MLRNQIRPAAGMTLLLMGITGLVYPGVVTGLAQALFPRQANGSLERVDGRVIGSELIAQEFRGAAYFRPRASAARWDATASGGTNKGPTDRKLADTLVAGEVARAVREDGARYGAVPADMATHSASGLDPHISPANAFLQAARVARARGVDPARVRRMVQARVEGRTLGVLGEPRVNVLLLNLALDRELGAPKPAPRIS